MTPKLDTQSKKPTISWVLVFSLCWTVIFWLHTSLPENPILFIVLTGLLIQLVLANIIVYVSLNRRA